MKPNLGISFLAPVAMVAAGAVLFACGGGTSDASSKVAAGGAKDQTKWPADDRSLCEWRNHPELEVSETAGPGALKPNVRRVYKDIGEAENRHKVLVCREIDTNLDGIKDVVRTFNAKGEAQKENADTNYDGRLDLWGTFVSGRISEEDVDTNFDGAPDLWKYYVDGKLSRIKRDRNFDGKPDVWEIYTNGHLERMGIDDTFDGHVDRWDRDESVHQAEEAAQSSNSSADAGSSVPVPTSMPGQDAGK
ncbi:MAG TPA: hypothetical protein VGI39_19885 [Polyangiaceae bacterium]